MTLRHTLSRLTGLFGLVGLLGASLSGCGSGNGGGGPAPGGRDACRANPTRPGRTARWTVLVYLNAANDLQPDSLLNIAQMASVGSDAQVNIIVQWKQANCVNCGIPSFVGTRRYRITRKSPAQISLIQQGDTTPLNADRLPDPATNVGGTSDMGDWRVLRDFIQWGTRTYPADNLCVVLWDHGSGWQPTRSGKNRLRPRHRAFSQDEETNNEIQTEEAPRALASAAQPIDVLAFDASLMQMTEVAYELRNSARVMVGSEDSPPANGYPYDTWLADLKASGKDPCDLGRSIVNRFVSAYPNNSNITQSVIDLSKMDALASALNNFANALRARVNAEAGLIQSARQNAQSYAYQENKDLYHYAQLIRSGTFTTSLQQTASALQTALTGSNGAVIVSSRGRFGQENSNGLAIYIPTPFNYDPAYTTTLALSRVTFWDEFLRSQVR